MNWQKDRELQLRMGIVTVLLGLLFSLFIGVIMFFAQNMIFMLIGGIIIASVAWSGPKIALKSAGAKKVSSAESPELHNRVNRISQQAGVQSPDVAIADSGAPNAFMAGRSRDSAVLCVSKGLIDKLDGEELDAVLAHEISHMKNRDMSIMMIASSFAAVAHFIVRWGWMADDGGQAGNGGGAIVVAILVSLVTWIGTYVLMRILSRYREFTADRGAAAITGRPSALASALRKIDDEVANTPDEDLRQLSGTNAMNFYEFEVDHMSKVMNTHPDTKDRISKLSDIESKM
jgi:heat shock protein HtpX